MTASTVDVDRSGSGFAGFLPAILRHRLEARGALPEEATAGAIRAVVLFVDIVGFTSMTDRLASEGRRGTEVVSQILNRELDPLVEEIVSRSGDLVVFAGDAVIAIWPYEDADTQARAVCSAAAVALANVQPTTQDAAQVAVDEPVPMRAAIGLGDLSLMEVGGCNDQWRFLVQGPGILDAVRADKHSQPGRVVLSPEAHAAAGASCRGVLIEDGFLDVRSTDATAPAPRESPEASAIVAQRLAPAFVPRAAVDRIRAGHGGWLAEFRHLTVLFIRLESDDASGTIQLDALQKATVAAQQLLVKYDGELYTALFDDKGTVLIGLFGLPYQAHEEDAERAALTAIELHDALGRVEVQASIGVASGLAFSGLYGAGARQQYMVVGSVMNLAARLMTSAKGAVLCDVVTARDIAGSDRVEARPAGSFRVKGKTEPVEVFAPHAISEATLATAGTVNTEMIGREEELRALTGLLANVGESRAGTLALIEGEAGTGKSLLAREFLAGAEAAGLRTAIGRASAVERDTPYYPWRTVVGGLLGWPLPENTSVRDRLQSLGLPDDLVRAAPVLGPLLGEAIPDNHWTAALSQDGRADVIRRLIVALMASASERPPVIWLDNVHLMDSASWSVVEAWLRAPQAAVVVTTLRSAADLPVANWSGDVPMHRIELGTLGGQSQRKLVEITLGADRVDDTLMTWITSQSGGNPLFVEQLTLGLRESGTIRVGDGRAGFSDEGAFGMAADRSTSRASPSLAAVITSRLDALAVDSQLTLKVLSVVDQAIDEEAVRLIHPTRPSRATLSRQIDELENRGFIERDDAEGTVSPKSALIRDAVYEAIPFALKTDLHAGIASWLESTSDPAGPQAHPALAFHWMGAERPSKALPHLAKAGEQALSVFANLESVRFFSKAIEVAERTASEAADTDAVSIGTWRVGMGRAYSQLQHYSEGVRELSLGLNLLGERLPRSSAALSAAGLAAFSRHLLRRARPGTPTFPPDEVREGLLWRSRAYESLMEASYVTGDAPRSLVSALRALNRAESAGPSAELARGYATVGAMMSFMPLHRAARSYGARAMAIANETGEPSARAWVQLTVGVYHVGMAEWGRALELLEEASELALEAGDRRRWVDCEAQVAQVHLMRGDLQRALNRVTSGLAEASRGQAAGAEVVPRHADQFLRVHAHVRLALGDIEQAARALQLFRDAMERRSVSDDLTEATVAAVRLGVLSASLGPGEPIQSDELVNTAWDFPFAPIPFCALEFEAIAYTLTPGEVPTGLDRARKRLLKTASQHARVFAVSRPVATMLKAVVGKKGSKATRIRSLREAAALAKGLERPLVEGTALLHLACLLPVSDPERGRSLEAAAFLFEEAGARPLLQRAKQAIGRG